MSESVLVLTTQNWQREVLESAQPVLVDFWAPWCAPCRLIAPIVEALAKDYEGRLRVGKLNVDDNEEVAGQYAIRSIPTLLVFRGGRVVEQRVGLASREDLTRILDPHLAASPAKTS